VEGTSTQLSFSTESEINNDYFTIERCGDGHSFSPIGQVKGAGTTRVPQQYTFIDGHPLAGKNYYRLRQVDFDGKSTYSPVASVVFGQTGNITLAPSPATDRVLIHLDKPAVEDGNWQVFDMAGRLVQSGVWISESDETAINVGALTEGMYTFRLAIGQTSTVKQFRKQ
jgi:Secretion system C-terminal sorting domain